MAYGPMSQVISYITGAAPATGFKGLKGGKFSRKDMKENTFVFNLLSSCSSCPSWWNRPFAVSSSLIFIFPLFFTSPS